MSGHLAAGLMTGTSVDGVDVAIVRLSGSGRSLEMDPVAFETVPIPDALRADILRCMDPATSDIVLVGSLNARLAHQYAEAVRAVLNDAGLSLQDLAVVGSHGQTVYHEPGRFSLQLGDPSMLAHLLGVTVVGDFRTGDVACGGQGAPLVPYAEWCLVTASHERRALVNLGGIANVTVLPPGAARSDVTAFDTGPANVLIDGAMQRLFDAPFDRDGAVALAGRVSDALVSTWLELPYFAQSPPKSTGRELFSSAFLTECLEQARAHGLSGEDSVASLTALTVRSVADALRQYAGQPAVVALSGGGARNQAVVRGLTEALPGTRVTTSAEFGLDPDAKEAICFAILAHEALQGVATGMPSVTGARCIAFQGKLCPPPA